AAFALPDAGTKTFVGGATLVTPGTPTITATDTGGVSASVSITVQPAPSLTGVPGVAAGFAHSCAVRADHVLWCWGENSSGQLGDGTVTNRSKPVAVKGLADATAVAAGGNHTCATLGDHTIRCWGLNVFGQLGDGTTVRRRTPVVVSGITDATAVS